MKRSKSKNITPLSIGASKYSPTQKNFPAVKHFWPCYQSEIGAFGLTDIISGVILNRNTSSGSGNPAIPWTYVPGQILTPTSPDGFSVYPNSPLAENNVIGTITNPYPKQCMLFAVAKFGAANGGFTLGNFAVINHSPAVGYSGISTSGYGACPACGDTGSCYPAGTNQFGLSGKTFTLSTNIYGRAISITNYSTTLVASESTITSGSVVDVISIAPTNGDNIGTQWNGLANLSNGWSCGQPTNLYGAALFAFSNGMPVDYLSAMAWMTAQWSSTDRNKTIYPGWKGLT